MPVRSPQHTDQHIPGNLGEAALEYLWLHKSDQYKADHRNSTSIRNATRHGRNTTVRATSRAPRPNQRAP